VRIEATVGDAGAGAEDDRPGGSWQLGREEEIALRPRARHPGQGGTEVAPYSIDDNSGSLLGGRWIEDLGHAPEDDVFQLVTRPEQAPDEPRR